MRRELVLVGVLLAGYQSVVMAESGGAIASFSAGLSSLRDTCSMLASEGRKRFSEAELKSNLELSKDDTEAEMDARVYAVGHGGRETTQYLADLQKKATEEFKKRLSDDLSRAKDDGQAVMDCVASAKSQGESEYVTYKSNPKNKKSLNAAESLMVAWLTNLKEIDFDHPDGSDATRDAWNSEKSRAEIGSL